MTGGQREIGGLLRALQCFPKFVAAGTDCPKPSQGISFKRKISADDRAKLATIYHFSLLFHFAGYTIVC